MGTAGIVITALAAAVAALTAGDADRSLPLLVGCLGAAAAAVAVWRGSGDRRVRDDAVTASLLVVAVASVVYAGVGLRVQQDHRGLSRPLPERLDAVGELGSDPERSRFGTDFEMVLDGRRWRASASREVEGALSGLRAGDRVAVEARVEDLGEAPRGWVLSRHLAGRLVVASAEPVGGTRPWFRSANWVHERLENGAASMDESHRSLYLGLVVGDDRDQSELTRFHFRASGLTHLLAVSGQNMVFVLAVLAPLSRRIGYRARWILGVAAIVAFVVLTRAEPSVLRAATMAILGLTATGAGRRVSGFRLVCIAVPILLIGDPMLVHSVGFRLSVAATSGLVLLARPIERRLVGPRVLRLPIAVTLAAQAGAVPVMVSTFGDVSLVAVPANLLAEPAAGVVMTLGLTTGLLAGLVREEIAWVLQVPVELAVWWVDRVAAGAAAVALPPSGVLVWAVLLAALMCSVHLWRVLGPRSVGRAIVVIALPVVLFLRPPLASPGEVVALPGGSELRSTCNRWELHLREVGTDERTGVEILESLWRIGVTRVDSVILNGPSPPAGEPWVAGRGWSGAPDLAHELGALLVWSTPSTGFDVDGRRSRSPPHAPGGPGCVPDA